MRSQRLMKSRSLPTSEGPTARAKGKRRIHAIYLSEYQHKRRVANASP